MKIALVLLMSIGFVTACAGQAANTSPKAHKAQKPAAPTFVCPDPDAQKACQSYDELVKAKDDGLPVHGYVCFRKNQDDVFVISFSKPVFTRHWDADSKTLVIDADQKRFGYGLAHTYRDGVEDDTVMPSLVYGGSWTPFGESGVFVSDKINFAPQDEKDHEVGISIDDSQLAITYKYQNKADKNMTYNLTIQRSTGRFSEHFQEEGEKLPFIEGTGRCILRDVH